MPFTSRQSPQHPATPRHTSHAPALTARLHLTLLLFYNTTAHSVALLQQKPHIIQR
jgi:hypothetical protein